MLVKRLKLRKKNAESTTGSGNTGTLEIFLLFIISVLVFKSNLLFFSVYVQGMEVNLTGC
jgi:hypothetical protein